MNAETTGSDRFSQRRAGILLHPTCLPGEWGLLGQGARDFVDFLASAGMGVWQMLPIGPTHSDLSPYQSLSAHAGNPEFVDLAELVPAGLLMYGELQAGNGIKSRKQLFELSADRFFSGDTSDATAIEQDHYDRFRTDNQVWLDDFCLFCAIREVFPGQSWLQWPTGLRDRDADTLRQFSIEWAPVLQRIRFEQFLFHRQWQAIRQYAHDRNILLFGDIPIFVAHDSADVWAYRRYFKLDEYGQPLVIAGVPPDYFSPDGQHWGNPLYNWEALAADGYSWWLQRLDSQRHLFDLIRIDHFRGLEAYWEIPADRPEPKNGYWAPGPAEHFLEACFSQFPDLPLIAENLGIISDEVENLRHRFNLPGMTVLQFGFDGSPQNPHLMHNHHRHDLVYTGTHDNDTTLGWYRSLEDHSRSFVNRYLGTNGADMPWPVIQSAFRSVSWLVIVPMQDVLGLGSEARFNTPGTIENNWVWQLDWQACPSELAQRLRDLTALFGRLV